MRPVQGCEWSESKWREFDDGHVPENLQNAEYETTLLVTTGPDLGCQCQVVDCCMDEDLVEAVYQLTVSKSQPWGTYVTLDEADRCGDGELTPEHTEDEQHLSSLLVSAYLKHVRNLDTISSLSSAHGVAVWALASEQGAQVPYHIDYAEQLRYEYNIIVPPLWAGTLQCTEGAVDGGEFVYHTGGLEHYSVNGYKGLKSSGDGACTELFQASDHHTWNNEFDSIGPEEWIRVPFKRNRLIVMSGQLPHLSMPVVSLPLGKKRVIVGFNVFPHSIGSFVQVAPEHSPAFRRRVAMHRLMLQNNKKKSTMTLEDVKSNPALSKLLVKAKRQRQKEKFAEAQLQLDSEINALLKTHEHSCTTAGELFSHLSRPRGSWPSESDFLVHLETRAMQGQWLRNNTVDEKWSLQSKICLDDTR